MNQAYVGRSDRAASGLAREDLAIRTVAVSLRSALSEIRRSASPDARLERIAAVIAWARDSIRVHERAVMSLQRAAGGAPGNGLAATLDARLDDVRGVLCAAERALDGEVALPVRP